MATKTVSVHSAPSNPIHENSYVRPHTKCAQSQMALSPVLSVFSKMGQDKLYEIHLLRDALSDKHIPEISHDNLTPSAPSPALEFSGTTDPDMNTLSCSICDVTFGWREEMLGHYREDWHRYNLRLQLAGRRPVGEQEFLLLLTQDISSISGSDSSESESSAPAKMPPKLMLYCHFDDTVCSVFRELVHHPARSPATMDELLQQISLIPEKTRFAVLMQTAGHFAGAIFHKDTVICHKTFHRYVVRAKGGTLQSTHDKCLFAKSVGAQIRRANEAALFTEIQELLRSWSDKLSRCDVIFLRIPVHSKHVFYAEGENFGFVKDDPRVRPVPVNTKRATFTEVKRIHSLMTSLFVHGTLDDFNTEDDVISESISGQSEQPEASSPSKPSMDNLFQALEEEVLKKETEQEESSQKKQKRARRAKKNPKPSTQTDDPKTLFFNELMEACAKCETPRVLSLLADIGEPVQFPVPDTDPVEVADAISTEEIQPTDTTIAEADSDEDWVLLADPIESVIAVNGTIEELLGETDPMHLMVQSEYISSSLAESVEVASLTQSTEDLSLSRPRAWGDLGETEKRSVLQMRNSDGDTPLHLAANSGFSPLIFHFLRYGADPTVKDKLGKVAYEKSRDKPSRDVFRRFMFSHPTAYDYATAKISSPLSPEMEEEQRIRKVEKKKLKSNSKRQKKSQSKGKNEEEGESRKLTEKEKRALAAEQRFMTPEGGAANAGLVCAQCRNQIQRDKFEKSSYIYCSMHCLKKHRQQL